MSKDYTFAHTTKHHHFNPGDTAYIVDHIYEENTKVRVIAPDRNDTVWVQVEDRMPYLAARTMLHEQPETTYGIDDTDMQQIDAAVAAEPAPVATIADCADAVAIADALTDKPSAFASYVEGMDALSDEPDTAQAESVEAGKWRVTTIRQRDGETDAGFDGRIEVLLNDEWLFQHTSDNGRMVRLYKYAVPTRTALRAYAEVAVTA